MDTILGILAIILLIISIPCLILGIIQPKVFSRFFKKGVNRKKTSLIFGSAFLVSIVLIIIFSAGTPSLADMKSPTNQKNLTVSGSTSYHNSNIKVYLNGDVAKEMKADDKGDFSTTVELKEGSNKIKASATNDKNKTKSCPEAEIVYDITPPDFSFDQPQSPTGSNKFTLKGKSEKNAQVIIYLADKEIKKTKVKNDSFEIKDIALNEGENRFTVKAIDEADNYSQPKEITVVCNKPKEEAKKSESPSQTPAPKIVTPTPTPQVEQTVDTMDQLWKAVDTGLQTRESIDIKYDYGFKIVTLTKDGDMFDSNGFVRDGYSTLVRYGREAFKIDGVDHVLIDLRASFTDNYGNSHMDTGMTVEMTKENFQKFNWDNLEYTPVSKQIEAASEYYFIHYSIQKNLNTDKLYLVL